ncbi:glycosyltransferase family 2 protein [Candidatus Woesearchaeota archaeon]|nr:glycosyltransferase family 2 protein [Candidatus Woesearchaeota archaeon]
MKYSKLSIIVPVFNEEKTLHKILNKLAMVDFKPLKTEIVIIDDFSTDGTREVLGKLDDKYKIFYHERNMGKGAAIRTGLSHVTGDIITIQDADMEYDPRDLPKLTRPIMDGRTKVVYGSRFIGYKRSLFSIPSHYIGNKLLSLATAILYVRNITDMETCYKMFTKDVIKGIKLRANRFELEPEITAKLIKSGQKIIELPIHYKSRSFDEGKKIDWRDGIAALYYLLKYRFTN